jgi:arylsulfatase A-like enzyme
MRLSRSRAAGVFAVGCILGATRGPAEPAARPNFVVIVADDLGFSDLGSYGGEIETPQLDALAGNGLRFTQFYDTGRCWPTREALFTGYYAQQIRRDGLPGHPVSDDDHRPSWAPLLPSRLRSLGYRSYHSGKWHLDGMSLEGGFDHSYLLEDQGRYFNPTMHYEDDKPLPPVPPNSGYYATTAIADRAIAYLRGHAEEHAGQPFFASVAFTAPHFPLHALAEDIARYRDRYRRGWDAVRGERWERIRGWGLVKGGLSAVEHRIGPPYPFPGWQQILGPNELNRPLAWKGLTDPQRAFQADKMAVHAAMVDRMDREIGRVLDQLRAMKALDDTLVFFLSDNGASAEIMVGSDGHDPSAEPGSAASYLCLGPGWSTVCNTPFRRHKTWVHEGGIATPLIVHWPRGITARGELRRTPGHVIDLVPTILDAVGVGVSGGEGRRVPPLPGRSLVPALGGGDVAREYLWWFHEGNRAIRVGDQKLVAAGAAGRWELYDLNADRAESNDLAAAMPDRVGELTRLWQAKAREFAEDAGYGADTAKDEPGFVAPTPARHHPANIH